MHGPLIARQSKASYLRGNVAALERLGLFAAVLEQVSPETRRLMTAPPPASAWVDGGVSDEIFAAVLQLRGREVLRRMAREGTTAGVLPLMRAALEGLLRLFGVSPASVFSRAGALSEGSTRGMACSYEPRTPRAGVLVLRHAVEHPAPEATLVAFAGSMESAFELCRTRGVIADPRVSVERGEQVARYEVTWE